MSFNGRVYELALRRIARGGLSVKTAQETAQLALAQPADSELMQCRRCEGQGEFCASHWDKEKQETTHKFRHYHRSGEGVTITRWRVIVNEASRTIRRVEGWPY